jgi:uncharacterized membrane protein (DUF4010 family)
MGFGFELSQRRRLRLRRHLEIYSISTLIAYLATRFFADYLHMRLYVSHGRLHLHHFLFGLALMPLTLIAGESEHNEIADVLSGAVTALILSEIKQLVLQNWSQ